jgi:hypothetical protein
MPISSGEHPATAKPSKRPRGARLRRAASFSSMSKQALAPSDSCDALPVPQFPALLFSLLSPSPSSLAPPSLSPFPSALSSAVCGAWGASREVCGAVREADDGTCGDGGVGVLGSVDGLELLQRLKRRVGSVALVLAHRIPFV